VSASAIEGESLDLIMPMQFNGIACLLEQLGFAAGSVEEIFQRQLVLKQAPDDELDYCLYCITTSACSCGQRS
jgi:hypothetical protein